MMWSRSRANMAWMTIALASQCIAASLISQPMFAAEPPITSLAFSPDGTSLVAISQAGLKIYGWPELKCRKSVETVSPNLHAVSFSPNGKKLAVAGGTPSENGTVEIYSWPDCKTLHTLSTEGDSVMSVCWLGNDSIAAGDLAHQVNVWNVETGETIGALSGHSRGVTGLSFLEHENMLVSAGIDQSVRVWALKENKLVHSLNIHTKSITDLAGLSAKKGLPIVASASHDRTVRFWQPTIGRMVRFVRLPSKPLDIAWLPDGSSILAACTDGRVRIIDPTNVKVTKDVETINGWCYSLAVHPTDGSFVAAGQNGQLERIRMNKSVE